jgi:hypothetical protein
MIHPIKRYTHWLHTQWPAGTVEKLPESGEFGVTNIPGVRIAGDLTGIPLLKFSSKTGAEAVRAILAEREVRKDEGGRMKDEKEAQNAASAPSHSSSFIPHPSSFRKILFFPDQHLGRNTAHAMSYPIDKMVVWDPTKDLGGNTPEQIRSATFILWKGHCSVHQLFRPEHVDAVRREHPNMKVIVHPECRHEVVEKADLAGSTAYIVKQIEAAAPGSEWAIGTEVHLVNRLKQQHPEQTIIVLSECQCLCTTMFRIDLPHLCWVLENLIEGKVVNEIKVDAHTRKWATVALERMLAIKGTGNPMARSNSPIVSQAEANRMGVVD